MPDYRNSIQVVSNPEACFRAITQNMADWWSTTSAKFTEVGDEATVSFEGSPTQWTFRAEKLSSPDQIVLKCTQAVHIEVGLPKAIREEWLGSKLTFDINENRDGSQIDFIHEGLGPQLICHDVCVVGWDHFFGNSLKDYVNASS